MSGESVPLPLSLARLADGDYEVTALYRELRKPLLRYLVCLGLSTDEAQDVVQDAFLTLHRHLSSGGSQENIRGWLFRVAHNQARNRQTTYDRRFAAPLDAEAESLFSHDATPERVVLEKERFRQLGKAIRLLADSERECLLLRAAGLRYREIGEVLAIPTSTVADTVDRAIKKLAEKCNV
jgi:RNA polymerase sigma-70 factor (ECF subfamily)